jgi:VanZ family protein
MTKFLKQYWKVIGWSVLIFTISSLPTLPRVGFIWWDFILKKSGHALEYAVLYTLVYKTMSPNSNWRTPLLFGLAFALSDEYHQSFVPGRSARFTDVGFDTFGMLIAYWRLKR